MTSAQWTELKAAFAELSDAAIDERERRLAELAESRPGFADELGELLTALGTVDQSMTHVVSSAARHVDAQPSRAQIGREFGAYRIVAHIARGGMGDVFAAERTDGLYDQRVAIKLISTPLMTEEDELRFASERQILARLSHPGIARILDGGTADDGIPYLVMEYIDGVSIVEYCRTQSLTLNQRLELFIQVCHAVEFAHRNLVVHRDIKPSNILVTHEGQPKLLDFGIAKIIDTREAPVAEVTELNRRALTPDFASPEQILGDPVTTGSDIYSLGVLLYLLTAGRQPYSTEGLRASERERLLCDVEPPKPSTTASHTLDHDPERPPFRLEPARLKGDLDSIILTAMHKLPDSRYASARALADDIRAYLGNRPVNARGRTFGYSAGKFFRRHRAATALAFALASSAVGAAVYHTEAVREQRDRAEAEVVRSASVIDFMINIFQLQSPDQLGATVTAKEVLDAGAASLPDQFAEQPQVHARIGSTIGGIYSSLGLYEDSARHYRAAIELHDSLGQPKQVAEAYRGLANALMGLGEYDEAREHFETALRIVDREYPAGDIARAVFLNDYGHSRYVVGEYDTARAYYEQAIDIVSTTGETENEVYGAAQTNLGQVLYFQGDFDAALPLLEAGLEEARIRYGETSGEYGIRLHNVAAILLDLQRFDEAEVMLLQSYNIELAAYGADYVELDAPMTSLVSLYRQTGRFEEAVSWAERAVEHSIRLRGREQFDTGYNLNTLAKVQARLNQLDLAAQSARDAQSIYAATIGEVHPQMASSKVVLTGILLAQQKPAEAQRTAQAAVTICEATLPDNHWLTYNARLLLGRAFSEGGDLSQGGEVLQSVFEGLEQDLPAHPLYRNAAEALMQHHRRTGDAAEEGRYQAILNAM